MGEDAGYFRMRVLMQIEESIGWSLLICVHSRRGTCREPRPPTCCLQLCVLALLYSRQGAPRRGARGLQVVCVDVVYVEEGTTGLFSHMCPASLL